MKKIGLCMIVKDEATVIGRCLDSVLPLIDYALIVDTGSTDNTISIIENYLIAHEIPATVIREAWQDFAYNRSHAMAKLREHTDIDYALMIDADEVLHYSPDFNVDEFKAGLDKDLYNVFTEYSGIKYVRPQLFSNHMEYFYKGVLHEYLECASPIMTRGDAFGITNIPQQDGGRSKNPDKYRDDAKTLENAIKIETDPFMLSRYTFYLAQSYKDCGDKTSALHYYNSRTTMGFWEEEVYISLLNVARLQDEIMATTNYKYDVIQGYMAAYEAAPKRLEALHGAIKYCRLNKLYQQGLILGKHALRLSKPVNGLFLEPWIGEYGIADEVAIIAYWVGDYTRASYLSDYILSVPGLSTADRERVITNKQFSTNALLLKGQTVTNGNSDYQLK